MFSIYYIIKLRVPLCVCLSVLYIPLFVRLRLADHNVWNELMPEQPEWRQLNDTLASRWWRRILSPELHFCDTGWQHLQSHNLFSIFCSNSCKVESHLHDRWNAKLKMCITIQIYKFTTNVSNTCLCFPKSSLNLLWTLEWWSWQTIY